CLTQKNWKI
ncbi:hypothetical protein E2320_019198, partial [Naja naja]